MMRHYHSTVFSFLALWAVSCLNFVKGDQPPYQVTLFLNIESKEAPIRLCNGAIVQTRLVLTTASCVHYRFIGDNEIVAIKPLKISIVAGNLNAISNAITIQVSSIDILDDFNSVTLENDLALLHLSTSLPLSSRTDIKWIILDEIRANDSPLLANFYINNLTKQIQYTQTEELQLLPIDECTSLTKYSQARLSDICSQYILPLHFECNLLDAFILLTSDRGTGIICKSRLVALLSTILLPTISVHGQNITEKNCSEMVVPAFYVSIGPHLDWIYEIIANEEIIDIMQANYKASAPYQQKVSAIIQSNITDNLNETSTTSTLITTYKVPYNAVLHNAAAANSYINLFTAISIYVYLML